MSSSRFDREIPTAPEGVHAVVREQYGRVATERTSCCGGSGSARATAEQIGYSADELDSAPEDANLGVGCGNPTALAALRPGETVVDLGAGAGLDALIAAQRVGPEGRVIGVDMTPEMLALARENAVRAGHARTVEHREGVIEALPVVSESADVVISNCVINLSPDKPQVFREAFRVLKPGGRLAVTDILLEAPLAPEVARLAAAVAACIGGAMVATDYLEAIEAAGFTDISFTRRSAAELVAAYATDPLIQEAAMAIGPKRLAETAKLVYSYAIEARKPLAASIA